jgi:hypothetical protein
MALLAVATINAGRLVALGRWAQPDTIVWSAPGSLSGGNPKIMPKPGGGLTQSHVDLMRSIESRN